MTRHKNVKSPYDQRRMNRPRASRANDAPVPEQLAAFDRMCAARPLKPPPGRPLPRVVTAAMVDARKARG